MSTRQEDSPSRIASHSTDFRNLVKIPRLRIFGRGQSPNTHNTYNQRAPYPHMCQNAGNMDGHIHKCDRPHNSDCKAEQF